MSVGVGFGGWVCALGVWEGATGRGRKVRCREVRDKTTRALQPWLCSSKGWHRDWQQPVQAGHTRTAGCAPDLTPQQQYPHQPLCTPHETSTPPSSHLDDGHPPTEASNALIQLLLLILLLSVSNKVADLLHTGVNVTLVIW